MVTTRKRSLPAENPVDGGEDATESVHEKSSRRRMEENKGKKNVGVLHLSVELNSECHRCTTMEPASSPRIGPSAAGNPPSSPPPPRRSSRLENVAPINYSEARSESDEEPLADDRCESDDETFVDDILESDEDSLADDRSKGQKEPRDAAASDYEKSRNERIKENQERMKNLGILHLSLGLKSECARIKPVRSFRTSPSDAATPAPPPRRSSRLQNVAPVNYSDSRAETVKEPLADDNSNWHCEGLTKEVYTEEHEKLLGTSELAWNLSEDGYDSNGNRIYDEVKGETCHQCRQTTIGHTTSCINCNSVQGQFCGDCLCMRYGENVLKVEKNSSWICPVCRGICNCSPCRVKKGWAPTGPIYKRVQNLGCKSVAHFLILTKRGGSPDNKSAEPNSPESPQSSTDAELVVKPELVTIDENEYEEEDEDNDSIKDMKPVGDAGLVVKSEMVTIDEDDEEEDNKKIKNMATIGDAVDKPEIVTIDEDEDK